ncbi:hypothetical protein PYCCODRAFT_1435712 [Trametes coccinea BRFM310]|uniref:Uncharacterized protein n=1 Tax=Trametes coccinea (strain BRFM310) TaxID=1353009 RepID=A0A1Y2ILM0_TRAC3|nr:hypothetical protein PYCCODRAFT_1435712 [Trametes coccinea BRFM310]
MATGVVRTLHFELTKTPGEPDDSRTDAPTRTYTRGHSQLGYIVNKRAATEADDDDDAARVRPRPGAMRPSTLARVPRVPVTSRGAGASHWGRNVSSVSGGWCGGVSDGGDWGRIYAARRLSSTLLRPGCWSSAAAAAEVRGRAPCAARSSPRPRRAPASGSVPVKQAHPQSAQRPLDATTRAADTITSTRTHTARGSARQHKEAGTRRLLT